MEKLKTVLKSYYLHLDNEAESAQYAQIVSDMRTANIEKTSSRSPETYNKKFADYWKAMVPNRQDIPSKNANQPLVTRDVELDTEYLLSDQWNTAPCFDSENGYRIYEWAEVTYPNRSIRVGYFLSITPEMREMQRNRYQCGYCGKQEPAQKGYVFCPHCLGSVNLTQKDLYLTRMQSVLQPFDRKPLTDAELAHLLPLFKEAQLHGNTERDKARIAKQRASIARDYEKSIAEATAKRDGFTWLLDHGLKIDNVIYYPHTEKFCFGWRTPIDESFKSEILEVISEFPFMYEMKCADGRTLSRDS